jgi:protein TonB
VTSSPATFDPADERLAEREEPLAPVLGLGGGEDRVVFVVALVAALTVHAVGGARALRSFPYLTELAATVRDGMQERLRSQVDIDMTEPPPPPKPEPEPEPEKEPEPPPPAQQKAPEPEAPPPAAAEAGKVLTAEPDPDEPVNFGDTIISNEDGERFSGGSTAAAGTSKTAVRRSDASATGVGTGAPKVAAAPAAPKVDLSKPARPLSSDWDCPFPSEAEAEGINAIKVQVVVTVTSDGKPRTVTVLKDPGFGFGRAARACALRNSYSPALDAFGKPVEQSFTVAVRFTR